jgi:hypothetical protein
MAAGGDEGHDLVQLLVRCRSCRRVVPSPFAARPGALAEGAAGVGRDSFNCAGCGAVHRYDADDYFEPAPAVN